MQQANSEPRNKDDTFWPKEEECRMPSFCPLIDWLKDNGHRTETNVNLTRMVFNYQLTTVWTIIVLMVSSLILNLLQNL